MSCGMMDNYEPIPNANHLDEEARWVTLHVHGREVSIEEGLLVPCKVRWNGELREVCFTDRLHAKYGQSPVVLEALAKTGLDMLLTRRRDDSAYLRRRVMRKDNILVVQDREGIIFMEQSDW